MGYIGVCGSVCFCSHIEENYSKNFATEKLPKPIQNADYSTISLGYGITLQTVFTKTEWLSHSVTSDTIPPSVMIYCDNQNHLPRFLNLHFKNQLWSLCLDTDYLPIAHYFSPLEWLKSPTLSSRNKSFIDFRHQQIPLTLVKSF